VAPPAQTSTVPALAEQLRALVLTFAHIILQAMDMVDIAKEHHEDLSTESTSDGIRFGEDTVSHRSGA
jgi:hypothetical protein